MSEKKTGMLELPEELKDLLLELIDGFAKADMQKFDLSLSQLYKEFENHKKNIQK